MQLSKVRLESIVSKIKADLEREAGCREPVIHQSHDCDQSSLPQEASSRCSAELEIVTQYPVEQDIEVEGTGECMSTSRPLAVGGHKWEFVDEKLTRERDRYPIIEYGGSGNEDTSHQLVEVDGAYGQQPPPAIVVTDEGAIDPDLPKSTSEERPSHLLESIGHEPGDPVMDLQYSASLQQQQLKTSTAGGMVHWTSEPVPVSLAGDRPYNACAYRPPDALQPG